MTSLPLGDGFAGTRLQRVSGDRAELRLLHPPPTRDLCPDTDRPDHLWWGYHCRLDKHVQTTYGLTCDDWWRLYHRQGGRCAICSGRPLRTRRLVVEHSHLTGEVRGLTHFLCNRVLRLLVWWVGRITVYLLEPPGRELGLVVPKGKRDRLEAKYQAKLAKERKAQPKAATNGSAVTYQDKLRAMTKQGG